MKHGSGTLMQRPCCQTVEHASLALSAAVLLCRCNSHARCSWSPVSAGAKQCDKNEFCFHPSMQSAAMAPDTPAHADLQVAAV